MKIVTFYIFTLFFAMIQCIYCPTHCFCYNWENLIRTDCIKKNFYNTFRNFPPETQVLDLSYNVISILHGNELQDANLRSLVDLRLSNNRLSAIDKLSFNGLEILERLDLSHNHIEYLNPDTFKYNINLKVLNVSHNPLRVKIDEPFLKTVPPSLSVLNMAHCNLEFLSVQLLKNLDNLRILNISDNRVRIIYPEVLEIMTNLKVLDISRNDLTCNEKSTALANWLINRKINFQSFCRLKNQQMMNWLPETKTDNMVEYYQTSTDDESNTNQSDHTSNFIEKTTKFFVTMPTFYAIICGVQVGLLIGALLTYLCMRKPARKLPPVPLRNASLSLNATRTSLAEIPSRFMNNDPDNMTFALIPLNTPPGTPPSPYHSRLTFSSEFSLSGG